MRNDTKLAIVVAVVSVGLAIWYLRPGNTSNRPVNPTADQTDDGSQPTSPAPSALTKTDQKSESTRLTNKPNTQQSGTAGSPSAVAVRDNAPRLSRPTPEVSAKPESDGPLGKALESGDATNPTRALVKEQTNVGTVSAKTTDIVAATTRPASAESIQTVTEGSVAKKAVVAKPKLRTHTVAKGDNLWNIAAKYLGDGKRYRDIVKVNPNMNPNRINVGDKIIIPAVAKTAYVSTTPSATAGTKTTSATIASAKEIPATASLKPAPIPAERAYKVKAGEGWYSLAQRLMGDGNRWPELYELNKGRTPRNKDLLPTGTVIELPKGVKDKQ